MFNDEYIKNTLESHQNTCDQLKDAINIDDQFSGYKLLSSEVDKFYRRSELIKNHDHFEETIVRCAVIIEKLKAIKNKEFSNKELYFKVDRGVRYYLDGGDNFRSSYYQKSPKKRSPDGHLLRSNAELIIDLWLNFHFIEHIYEPKVFKKGKFVMTSDFYLPQYKCYIEYWGLEGDIAYERRMDEKIQIYNDLGLKLVSIRNTDIDDLDKFLLILKETN